MPYAATVVPVMIASPADVHEYRAAARDVINEWNYIHSASTGTVLLPVGWDTHSSPELGASAQDLINDRVLEDCDLLIGIFWTRLGSPTTRAPSGTVEEIQRHVKAGKPAMIYFSQQPVAPESIDAAQYAALREFRGWCESKGIIETFFGSEDLQTKLRRHVQIAIQKNDYLRGVVLADQASPTAQAVQAEFDTAVSGLSPEARELLVAAASHNSGTIIAITALSRRMIQAGTQSFGQPNDRRAMAKWDYGLEQLVTLELVRKQGDKVFVVTELGYRTVDVIESSAS
jgi:hypothetical protein